MPHSSIDFEPRWRVFDGKGCSSMTIHQTYRRSGAGTRTAAEQYPLRSAARTPRPVFRLHRRYPRQLGPVHRGDGRRHAARRNIAAEDASDAQGAATRCGGWHPLRDEWQRRRLAKLSGRDQQAREPVGAPRRQGRIDGPAQRVFSSSAAPLLLQPCEIYPGKASRSCSTFCLIAAAACLRRAAVPLGAAIGAVWNYAMSSVFVWRSRAPAPPVLDQAQVTTAEQSAAGRSSLSPSAA